MKIGINHPLNRQVALAVSLAATGLIAGIIHVSFPYRISQLQSRLDHGAVIIGLIASVATIVVAGSARSKCSMVAGNQPHRLHRFICTFAVVAGIIGLLLSLGGGVHSSRDANITATRMTLTACLVALDKYREDMGTYPTPQQGLEALVRDPNQAGTHWKGPYLDRMPCDAWGGGLRHRLVGGQPMLRSAGADRIFDTRDDLTN